MAVPQPDFEWSPAVEDKFRTREMVPQLEHQRFGLRLFEVHKNCFSQKQEGARRMHLHLFQPGILEHRAGEQMIVSLLIADELPAQFDDIRKIQVVPLHLAVVHTFEARIESASDVNHYSVRVMAEEIPGVAVEFAGEYDPH